MSLDGVGHGVAPGCRCWSDMTNRREVFQSEGRAKLFVLGLVFVLLTVAGTAQTPGAVGIAFGLAIAALEIGAWARLAMVRVVADDQGLGIRNFFGSRFIPWHEIDRVQVGPNQFLNRPERRRSRPVVVNTKQKGLCGQVVLRDGRIYLMSGISGSMFHDPGPQVQALNSRLAAARQSV